MGNTGGRFGLQLGFAVAGGLLGALGGFGQLGFAIGALTGSILGSFLFPADQQNTDIFGPRLDDLAVQTSTYGNAIPALYGKVRIAGNVIWSTGLIEHATSSTEEVETGKGGQPPTTTTWTYTYTASFAISLCSNEIVGIGRIWTDDKLWYDFNDPPVGVNFAYELYTGTETQLPCSAIEADKGAGNVPAFRGQAYIVFKDLLLTKFGNRIPNFHFEVIAKGTTAITAQFYQSPDPHYSWFTDLAIDLETGFVWAVHGQKNRVLVLTPDLDVVRIFQNEITRPTRIAYQPAYHYLDIPFALGFDPSPAKVEEMPPRMFISSDSYGFGNIGGGMAATINTRTYEVNILVDADGDGNPFELSTAHLIDVDMRTIAAQVMNEQGPKTLLVHGNWDANAIVHTINDYSGWGTAINPTEWTRIVAEEFLGLCADTDFSDNKMTYGYAVFWSGKVWAVDEDYARRYEAQPVVGSISSRHRLKWDKFERKIYLKIEYENSDEGLSHIIKMSEDLGTVHWDTTRGRLYAWEAIDIHPQTGALYALSKEFLGNWWIHELDKATGAILSSYEIADTANKIWAEMQIYPYSMFAMVSYVSGSTGGGGVAKVPLTPGPTSTTTTLKQVVEDISLRTGLTLSDINASALAGDTVRGYALASRMPARNALEPLMRGYFFDAVETDNVAKFVKRGGSSVKTIAYADTARHESGAEAPARRERTRQEEGEMPWQVDVSYMDEASLYKINVQYARRLIGEARSVMSVPIAAVFTATEAHRIAEVLLYNAWVDRQQAKMLLSTEYVELDPTDVVTFQDEDSSTQTYRIVRAEYTYPNRVDLELVEEDASVYSATGTGVDADVPAQTIPSVAPTLVYFMDISLMGREQDDAPGFYFAGTPSYGTGWPGAALFQSTDGTTYTAAATFPSATTAGVANTTLGYEGSIP